MNSIKTLEGNDIFEVSRIFQKMYENALDDYVEVVPPNITRAAAINEKTSASFKDFTILWNKIIAYSNAYAYKYNLPGREIVDAPNSITKDDEDAASEYVIELFKDIGIHKDGKSPSISSSSLAYNFETVLEEINGRINHEQTNGREIIAGVLLRETRIIANKFLTKKEKTSSGNQTFLEMTDRFNVFIEATKGISYAHKSDSKDSRVYDELNNLNNPLIDAISRLEEHFVPWNDLIMSGSIKYNQDEVSAEIILLETNVKGHVTKSVLHNNIVKNIKIVKEYMSKFGSNAIVKKDGIFHQETNYDPVVGDGVDVEEEYESVDEESVDEESVDDESGYESSLSSVGVDFQGEGLKKKKRAKK